MSKESQQSFEQLYKSFETAVKIKPSHRLHRMQSLERLREDFGTRNSTDINTKETVAVSSFR